MPRTATTAEQRIFDLFAEFELAEMGELIDRLEEFRRFVEKRDAVKQQPKKPAEGAQA